MNPVNYTLTFGEKRVQRSFNPSANTEIEQIKEMYAKVIDHVETLRNSANNREVSLAQTELETSCMYAVKSLFV